MIDKIPEIVDYLNKNCEYKLEDLGYYPLTRDDISNLYRKIIQINGGDNTIYHSNLDYIEAMHGGWNRAEEIVLLSTLLHFMIIDPVSYLELFNKLKEVVYQKGS